jgi:GT2 family glycosyltransferase
VTLSIIIVNYNVKFFLEQCLCSVRKAIQNFEAEVFIVDNNSSDESVDYLKPKFPFAQFIINNENVGFSKANNQALAIAKGKYILFLNPDTIIEEDSFEKCIQFLGSNADAGALGVKMIDGSGTYLKESKRGFPSPWVSFCKLSGLTSLFPHSKIFAKYYLGNLSEKENQEIDSISGAFFFARKNVLDKIGGFDERFFMYAEDIDLSFRIQQAGYKNFYFSESTIIHFKGESTKKDFRYTKSFYKAMSLFAKKNFSRFSSFLFSILIDTTVGIRGVFLFFFHTKSVSATNEGLTKKFFLFGDKTCCHLLEERLVSKKMLPVTSEKEASEIIFCEGNNFSYKKIIQRIQTADSNKILCFHSLNSNSVVASSVKSTQGEFISLDS